MEIRVTKAGGEEETVSAVSVRLESEKAAAADSAVIIFPFDALEQTPVAVRLICGGEAVFYGQTDVFERVLDTGGKYLRLEARSAAGILLDNEAVPCEYGCPTDAVIFCRHLSPYGFTGFEGDAQSFNAYFNVTKGMSEWQALCSYCDKKYGSLPAFTEDGRVIFNPPEEEGEVVFSDCSSDGAVYDSIKERYNRYKLISEVRVKRDRGGAYDMSFKSEAAQELSVTAIRYLDATIKGTDSVAGAQKLLKQAEADSYSVEIQLPEERYFKVGTSARVTDSRLGELCGLYIESIRLLSGTSGSRTTVILKKKIGED